MDFRQLFKLRLVVAAMGETQQGFPRSTPFAQTRAGLRVAQLEDAFENERNRWMNEAQEAGR